MIKTSTHSGVRIYSLESILMNKWAVKASITENGDICVVLFNVGTYELIVKYFEDEEIAHDYITYKVNLD